MENLRNATLVFLIKKSNNEIREICLAMKKRGFGIGKWNGVGGKEQGNETPEETAIRETKEEINVDIEEMKKVGNIKFYFPNKPEFSQHVHVYFAEKWIGEPTESEEMDPKWFNIEDIPFENMWVDDPFWVPLVIKGKQIKGEFVFGDNNELLKKEVVVL